MYFSKCWVSTLNFKGKIYKTGLLSDDDQNPSTYYITDDKPINPHPEDTIFQLPNGIDINNDFLCYVGLFDDLNNFDKNSSEYLLINYLTTIGSAINIDNRCFYVFIQNYLSVLDSLTNYCRQRWKEYYSNGYSTNESVDNGCSTNKSIIDKYPSIKNPSIEQLDLVITIIRLKDCIEIDIHDFCLNHNVIDDYKSNKHNSQLYPIDELDFDQIAHIMKFESSKIVIRSIKPLNCY